MSDDSFIREVDEELRRDQLKYIWKRFGSYLIGAAVLVVLLTAGYRGWEYYSGSRAAASGDRFLEAVDLSRAEKPDEALSLLREIEKDGWGSYPQLAGMRAAAELAASGDRQAAIEAYDALAARSDLDPVLRSVASLRAGMLAVDVEPYEEVRKRLEPLAAAGQPFRSLAREALGLSAFRAGDDQAAAGWFRQIADDGAAGSGVKARAGIMLDLLAGRGVTGAG